MEANDKPSAAGQPAGAPPTPAVTPTPFRPLRVWPAVLLVIGMVVLRALPNLVQDGPAAIWMSAAFGPALCGILVLIWWLALSRATGRERLLGFFAVMLAFLATVATIDPTMRGPAVMVLTVPSGLAAFALGAALLRGMPAFRRTTIAISLAVLGFGGSLLLRNEGMWGDFNLQFRWRWTPSAEQTMLAGEITQQQSREQQPAVTNMAAALAAPEWPGFRGADRTSRQRGVKFATDWNATPPVQLWRISIGPAWSSFAVAGRFLFTQEQRGEQEAVVCLDADTGREVWKHEIAARFFDPMGGPGPRATPQLADGRLFALGAKGTLLCLDARDGALVWQQDIGRIAGRPGPPMWGYCSSPLVNGSLVIVYAGGKGDKGTLAFDVANGDLKWSATAGEQSYSSAQLANVCGEEQILMLSNLGLKLLESATGKVRFFHEWEHKGYRSLQPQVVGGDSVILPTGMGTGTRRIRLTRGDSGLTATELWTTKDLKSDYNDFVLQGGFLYGFDVGMFTCLDLETGKRRWKGGRHGKGQVLLLEDSGLLLIAGERGEVVLVRATPESHQEVATLQMLTGKTWNHPVVVGDRLYHRNSAEAVCYRLPTVANPGTQPKVATAR